MPNHVMSTIQFSGEKERVAEIMQAIKGDETLFDFDKVIPMPKSLDIVEGSDTQQGLKVYGAFVSEYTAEGIRGLSGILEEKEEIYLRLHPNIDKEKWELGKTAYENQQKYGAATWYDWRISNWGSKWSAYRTELIDDNTIEFQTAWSNVEPVIFRLSEKFSEVEMHYRWADEDTGFNVGDMTYKGGQCIESKEIDDDSKEAYEFAAEMWGFDLREEGFVYDEKSGTYKWVDDEEWSECDTDC